MFALFGGVCYIIGYILKYSPHNQIIPDILLKIADILVIGVVVGYLTSLAQWSGVFKSEIQNIIFGKSFIGVRSDIESVWYNVTKQLFKYKFETIHKDLFDSLKQTLPNDDTVSYYEDYDIDIKVEWVDKDKGLIKTTENIDFVLSAESDNEFSYTIKTSSIIDNDNPVSEECKILPPSIKIDGKVLDTQPTKSIPKGKEIWFETTIPL